MNRKFVKGSALALGMAGFLCLSAPARAQNVPVQDRPGDVNRDELAAFHQFLDTHPEIGEQVRKNPSLLDDRNFVSNHPALDTFLRDHPGINDRVRNDAVGFMREEDRFGRDDRGQDYRADNRQRDELAAFHDFLDNHRDLADRVRRDPSLLNNQQFLQDHQDLRAFLQDHPGVNDQVRLNAVAFMQEEDRFGSGDDNRMDQRQRDELVAFHDFLDQHRDLADQVRRDPSLLDNRDFVDHHEDLRVFLQDHPGVNDQIRNNAVAFMREEDQFGRDYRAGEDYRPDQRRDNREDVAQFHAFLDSHPEIAEQVRRDPSLCDNRDFVENHQALKGFLQDHPAVRDDIRNDRSAFMQQESQFNRTDNDRGRDFDHDHLASFGGFLNNHQDIARDVSRDPNVVKNHDYVQNHAEFAAYLNANPGVRDDLMGNPQAFVKSSQQFNSNGSGTTGTSSSGAPNSSGSGSTGRTDQTQSPQSPTQTPAPAPNNNNNKPKQ
jgi:hypothetical protein